jgi:cysteine desulfurase / selenocysteine lyase
MGEALNMNTSVAADFPLLAQKVHGEPLTYLDSAATTQKPLAVIEALEHYYRLDNSNVHRGAHAIADRATRAFEDARDCIAEFIGAGQSDQIIWTRGATEAINLVAQSYGRSVLTAGDTVLVPVSEHHANIVPWQMVAIETGAKVVRVPLNQDCEIDLSAYADLLATGHVKIVAVNQISNALGTVNPIRKIIEMAKAHNAAVLVDGAQAVAHSPVDVEAMGCDFYVFSGHKLYGPTGIGVLWGKRELLEAMPPYQGGGEMIDRVSFDGTTFNQLPFKFEAGTPNIAGAIGLAAAVRYLQSIGIEHAAHHEETLFQYLLSEVKHLPAVERIGNPSQSAAIFSFKVAGAHPSDIGMLLDQQGVAIRTGHHCTQPLMQFLNLPGTARASLAVYNTRSDIDRFILALQKACDLLT